MKGFSLFTPLVGTTLIILAISLATMMVQNDIRASRSLSFSSIVTRDYVQAKIVKATYDVGMISVLKEMLEEKVNSKYTGDAAGLQYYFTGPAFKSSLKDRSVLKGVEALRSSLGIQELQDDTAFLDKKEEISKSLQGKEVISIIAENGKYCASVLPSGFKDQDVKQAMSVHTKDPESSTEQVISFTPTERLSACLDTNVQGWVDDTSNIWEGVTKNSIEGTKCSEVDSVIVTRYTDSLAGDGVKVVLEYDHDYGTFKAIITSGSTSGNEEEPEKYHCQNGKLSKQITFVPPEHIEVPPITETPEFRDHGEFTLT